MSKVLPDGEVVGGKFVSKMSEPVELKVVEMLIVDVSITVGMLVVATLLRSVEKVISVDDTVDIELIPPSSFSDDKFVAATFVVEKGNPVDKLFVDVITLFVCSVASVL